MSAATDGPIGVAQTEAGGLVETLRGQWHRLALAAILLLSAFLGLWNIGRNGYANEYYSAAVRSMLESWRNFLFVSFDPGGLVSVDKPPLALWVEAASAWAFGYSGWAILLPEAIAGVAAVGLLYLLVRRVFGVVAGLVAALALAVSPVNAAVNRDNNPDALLVLLLVLAAYCVVRALEHGRMRWVLAGAVALGLAFNTKMLAAGIVVPALGLAYVAFAPVSWKRRALQLGAAAVVLIVVSGAWIAAVELTPASERPYVGSTSDNSALSLFLDYNGLGRVAGQEGGTSFGGGGGLGGAFSGTPGVLRLFNDALGDQGAWLLPLAALGLLSAAIAAVRLRRRLEGGALLVLGGWFATAAAIFSWSSGIIHTYYLSALAPAACGLVGVGAVALWRDARSSSARAILPVVALLATAAVQVELLGRSDYLSWLEVPVLLGTIGAAVAIGVIALAPDVGEAVRRRTATIALAVGIGALLLAPAAWSRTTVLGAVNGVFPGAGPSFIQGLGSSSSRLGMGFPGGGQGRGGPPSFGGQGGSSSGMGQPPSFGQDGSSGQGGPPSFGGQGSSSSGMGQPPSFGQDGSSGQGGPPSFGGRGSSSGQGGMPSFGGRGGSPGGFGSQGVEDALAYAKANGGERRFTLIVSSAQAASSSVIAGENVAAMGGFTGRETVLTADLLAQLVESGDARTFLLGGGGGGPFGSANEAADIIASVCTAVPSADWNGSSTTSGSGTSSGSGLSIGGTSSQTLYDCSGAAAKIRAEQG